MIVIRLNSEGNALFIKRTLCFILSYVWVVMSGIMCVLFDIWAEISRNRGKLLFFPPGFSGSFTPLEAAVCLYQAHDCSWNI